MHKKPLFWEMFGIFFIVGTLNWIATERHLYWVLSEFDSLMHFLGGAFLSLFFLWLYFYSGFFSPKKRDFWQFFYVSMLGLVFVGVLWEAYELLIGEAQFSGERYPYDTTLDFIMDFLGAFAALLYGYMKEINIRPIVNGQA